MSRPKVALTDQQRILKLAERLMRSESPRMNRSDADALESAGFFVMSSQVRGELRTYSLVPREIIYSAYIGLDNYRLNAQITEQNQAALAALRSKVQHDD